MSSANKIKRSRVQAGGICDGFGVLQRLRRVSGVFGQSFGICRIGNGASQKQLSLIWAGSQSPPNYIPITGCKKMRKIHCSSRHGEESPRPPHHLILPLPSQFPPSSMLIHQVATIRAGRCCISQQSTLITFTGSKYCSGLGSMLNGEDDPRAWHCCRYRRYRQIKNGKVRSSRFGQ